MKQPNRGWWLLIGVCFCSVTLFVAPAQSAPGLRALDFYPVDVSADGSVVTGGPIFLGAPTDHVWKSIVWNSATGSRQEIGLIPAFPERVGHPDNDFQSTARRISADGSVAVGAASLLFEDWGWYGPIGEAFRWTAATGTVGLGTTVGGPEIAATVATGVSADGYVVVGNSSSFREVDQQPSYVAFRWTTDTGMTPLSELHFASAVSDDGKTIVGLWSEMPGSEGPHRYEAARWTAEEGAVRLGTLPGDDRSAATDVSADGSVVVGVSYLGQSETRLFRWTAAGGMSDLGRIATSTWGGSTAATSADGSIIVGNGNLQSGQPWEPFIWDEAHGMRPLSDALIELGVDVGGWDLASVNGISGDGRTFIGSGVDPSGNASGWIVTVPEPASPALLTLAAAAFIGRRGWRCDARNLPPDALHRARKSN